MTTLLTDIEAFLVRHNMAPTALGAMFGDRHFVRQLRGGRWVRPTTEAKARNAMATFEREHAAVATGDETAPSDRNGDDLSTHAASETV